MRAARSGWMECFFFSSRRRHTRYWRDWSSDVCSSDLERWDVIVDCTELGAWVFHCHVLSHAESEHGMFGMVTAGIAVGLTSAAAGATSRPRAGGAGRTARPAKKQSTRMDTPGESEGGKGGKTPRAAPPFKT